MKPYAIRTLGELGPGLTLAPERHRPVPTPLGVPLSDLALEVRTRRASKPGTTALVLDTSHVRDGVVSLPRRRDSAPHGAKTHVPVGAVLISRLRPYLRQVAFVSPALVATGAAPPLVCSTEFSVLVARDAGESLAFLVPFLLSADVQARLLSGQEGGHRPRVPREILMSLPVPHGIVQRRRKTSARVEAALGALYAARSRWTETLG